MLSACAGITLLISPRGDHIAHVDDLLCRHVIPCMQEAGDLPRGAGGRGGNVITEAYCVRISDPQSLEGKEDLEVMILAVNYD